MFGFLRHYRGLTWVIIACLGVSLAGCSSEEIPQALDNPPEQELSQTAPSSVERVVVLTSIAADILLELDETTLVGVPDNQLLKANPKFSGIPQIGLRQNPNLETLIEQQPDLVIGAAGMQGQILARLEELGIEVLGYELNNLEDLEQLTRDIAERIGANPDELLKRYQGFIPEEFAGSSDSILLLAGSQPVVAPNRQSWAGDLLANLGVNNLSAQWQGQSPFRGYVTLSPEKIVEADPERLLIIATPGNDGPLSGFEGLPFWDNLTAVRENQVYVFDYYGLVNPGSLDKIEGTYQQLTEILGE